MIDVQCNFIENHSEEIATSIIYIMSIDINWNLFDKQLSHEIQDKLNQYLDTIENPDFLGKLMITNLDFGTIPPDLEIIDICDPSIEFYENSDEDYDEPMSSVSPWESASQSGSTKEKLIAEREGSSNHCQIECALRYKGDLTLKLSAEVLIHHPTPNFITLPLTLTLKHLELNARVICAYLGDTVNFCLNQESR